MAKRILKEVLSWVAMFAVAIMLALIINRFVFFQVEVPTGSMENTIMIGDRVFTLRLAYIFSSPKRGDIVVFPYPDDETVDYIKRIIGIGNDKIEIKDGVLYINDEQITEDYLYEPMRKEDFGPVIVPEGHYFMMGDNRNISGDARVWENRFVKREKIKGKAIFKYPNFKWLN
jgi:signal peptidase I